MNRFDHRTKDQFKKDIKEATKIESILMAKYVGWLNKVRDQSTAEYTYEDHGIDNTGEFLEKVDCRADFILKRSGVKNKKIDIKFAKKEVKCFHLKVNQMMQYIQEDVCVINFIGAETDQPKFCIIPPSVLSQWLEHGERVNYKVWGGKLCIKFPVEEMEWHNV